MALCEKCQTPILPVVALDIDGTLGDYHAHINEFARNWFGPDRAIAAGYAPVYDGTRPHRDWFTEAYECDVTTFRQVKLAYRQGGWKRTMPPFPGARSLVSDLREIAEVWLTTTRPWDRYDRIDPDTKEWCRRNRIEFDALLFDEDKVEVLMERAGERVCFFLDDEVEQLDLAEAQWPGSTVLRSTQYNRGIRYPVMARGMDEAREMAKAHITDWQIKQEAKELP
jgi:hypothetical protein